MDEIQSQSDHYRYSSSSASSPVSRLPSNNFYYLRKPGSLRQPVSFEDSPDWDDTDVEVKLEESRDHNIAATTTASHSGSLSSPPQPEATVVARKFSGASVAWKDLKVTIKALLQLPGFLCGKKSVVEDAIVAMSLSDHANSLIGGHYCTKGFLLVRNEFSIARELVMKPHLLFIDEPLYHLDSVSALLMMVTLKKLASTGCTLIFTIYQSSTEVFGLFDRICLLSNGKTLFFGETLACLQHFSNAGFPCPIMQSPSDHFLRAINSDFDRIITLCKTWQDDHGDLSSVTMDSSVAIRTLEETYKLSADAAAVETMIRRLTEKEGPSLKSKGKASNATRIAVLSWRSLLIMSREWKYYWLRLILYLLLTLCIGTLFSGLGHSLTSVGARVGAIFLFISFSSLLSIVGIPAQLKEVKVYASEDSNKHSGAFVFLTSQFFASIPFLFLISISSSLLFCFLMGLRNEFSYLMYFVLNFFMCLLVNEGLVLAFATILQDMFWSISLLAMMMLSAGFFRIRSSLPRTVWMYPVSYIAFHTFSIQVLIKGGKGKAIKKGMRNRNSCSLCGGANPNKRAHTSMFKDQDEVVVAQDEVVQEKVDLIENEKELI
ncbi:ABC transporter G family member 3 [Tanacetum coccineum]